MSNLCIKKTGGIYQVYVDENLRPVPISSYEDNVEFAFPNTYTSLQEALAAFPGMTPKVFEAPPRPEPKVVEPVSMDQKLAAMSALGLSTEARKKVMDRSAKPPGNLVASLLPAIMAMRESSTPVEQAEVAKVVESSVAYDQAVQEFKVLLARYYANPKDVTAKVSVEAVGSFLISIWPDIADKLHEAKRSFEKPRFSL